MRNRLMWVLRQIGLVAMSEYDVVYSWYEEKRDECAQLYALLEVANDKLLNEQYHATELEVQIAELNDTIEMLSSELDTLQQVQVRRKPQTRNRKKEQVI